MVTEEYSEIPTFRLVTVVAILLYPGDGSGMLRRDLGKFLSRAKRYYVSGYCVF